jgi:hypothetical protein
MPPGAMKTDAVGSLEPAFHMSTILSEPYIRGSRILEAWHNENLSPHT